MTLDTNSTIWVFTTWGRPFRLVSPFLDCSSPKTTPVQIECGDTTCTILTKSGDVYTWSPFGDTLGDLYREGMAKLDKEESTKAILPDDRTVIPCHTWEIKMDPAKLPELPDLPDLPGTGLSEEERRKETKLIKIAALPYRFIGLTNKGHVLVSDNLFGKKLIGCLTMAWYYVRKSAQTILYRHSNGDTQLPNYSEIDKVKKHRAFRTTTGGYGKTRPPEVELSSDTMLITDVSYIASISSGFPSNISQRLGFCK